MLRVTFLTAFVALSMAFVSYLFFSPQNTQSPWSQDGQDDPAAVLVLRKYHGVECPRNFTLYRVILGDTVWNIQTRTAPDERRTIERCEPQTGSTFLWDESDPSPLLNDTAAALVTEACDRVAYRLDPDKTEDVTDGGRVVEEVDEVDDGVISISEEPPPADQGTLLRGIFPGTLWCGFGNLADDIYSRLGEDHIPDVCCRAHDFCKPIIDPFITKFHHRNPSFFPISHCACDVALYNCMKKVNSTVSNEIGRLFFNFARMLCFDFEMRDVCTQRSFGYCWRQEQKCAAVVRENPLY